MKPTLPADAPSPLCRLEAAELLRHFSPRELLLEDVIWLARNHPSLPIRELAADELRADGELGKRPAPAARRGHYISLVAKTNDAEYWDMLRALPDWGRWQRIGACAARLGLPVDAYPYRNNYRRAWDEGWHGATGKLCARCGTSKPLDAFSPHPGRACGRQPWCKACRREYQRDRAKTTLPAPARPRRWQEGTR